MKLEPAFLATLRPLAAHLNPLVELTRPTRRLPRKQPSKGLQSHLHFVILWMTNFLVASESATSLARSICHLMDDIIKRYRFCFLQ